MENMDIYMLMEKFDRSQLTTLEIEKGNEKILMKKETGKTESFTNSVIEPKENITESENKCQPKEDTTLANVPFKEIKAPLVGLFYRTPSPDCEPFVKEGEKVTKGQVLCIIEAMKMFNELKSPVDGIIKNILPENGAAVQFNQVLFEVEEC